MVKVLWQELGAWDWEAADAFLPLKSGTERPPAIVVFLGHSRRHALARTAPKL
jgi:hypothetical protein